MKGCLLHAGCQEGHGHKESPWLLDLPLLYLEPHAWQSRSQKHLPRSQSPGT